MNKSPIIGVTPLWDAECKSVWMLPDYLDGIKAAGGLPIILPIEMTDENADQIVVSCDGFLFTGGQDVASELYGTKDTTGAVVSSPERDKLEMLLLKKALQAVRDLGCDLTPMAVAPDGIIEAAQMTNRRFVWAVQWHPEYMFKTDSDSSAIFSWFVEHCI